MVLCNVSGLMSDKLHSPATSVALNTTSVDHCFPANLIWNNSHFVDLILFTLFNFFLP